MTQEQSPDDRKLVPITGLRGIISRSMTQAWQAPRVALGLELEMGPLLARAKAMSAAEGVKITPTVLLLVALARTLKLHPRLNALFTDKGIEEVHAVNLTVAVHTEKGLLTPVIRDAEQKSAVQLAAELGELASLAREGKLPPTAYQKGTFTLSNLAAAGIDWVTPILNAPQVSILGVGRTREAVVVRDGAPAVAQVATLTLVFDHRAVDGYPASLFLRDLGACLTAAQF
ncbi:2-oxo acid dehydrogenase subunit E2 [Pseudomonas fluorescens]|uniref:Dihydrolipoyllysine-residue acetyltransferase component of pyruvate dehydrogenase complex n=1 Tax=Pseudomonas fluorescens TaxID=294 RepID=A0A5E7VFT1_PSEFL|nr:2-oxo acid dehydrogenase subunit E2 [Pseudomonas fluorescens]VVQ20704.1 Dihydrolipoyllysine-residue acetyltransferase component of pyruvate dehydrogenase complex [Pseudomonas fluorescens]